MLTDRVFLIALVAVAGWAMLRWLKR